MIRCLLPFFIQVYLCHKDLNNSPQATVRAQTNLANVINIQAKHVGYNFNIVLSHGHSLDSAQRKDHDGAEITRYTPEVHQNL